MEFGQARANAGSREVSLSLWFCGFSSNQSLSTHQLSLPLAGDGPASSDFHAVHNQEGARQDGGTSSESCGLGSVGVVVWDGSWASVCVCMCERMCVLLAMRMCVCVHALMQINVYNYANVYESVHMGSVWV